MARKLFLAAGVLSLILVGLRGEAQAATTHVDSHDGAGVLTFFGHRLCFANAPATTKCDWRVPSAAKQQPGPLAADIDVFGVSYCLGAEMGAQCDYRITAPSKAVAQNNHFHFMGMTFCVPGTHCHSRSARLAGK